MRLLFRSSLVIWSVAIHFSLSQSDELFTCSGLVFIAGHIFHNNSEVKICYVVSSSFYGHICDVKAAKREWL